MRRTSFFNRRRELKIEMTPMIDVVFLLLVFFVYAAADTIIEYNTPAPSAQVTGSAPSTQTDPLPEEDFPPVVVRLVATETESGISINGSPVDSLSELESIMQQSVALKSDAKVFLHPDPAVPYGRVIDVYDSLIKANVNRDNIAFSATAPS